MDNSNSKTFDTNFNKHRYGFLSMLALIVGSVIGSGIYVVNDKLYVNSGHSTGIAMLVWILISIVVLFMLISFIEISSITAKTGEAGTVNNWTRHLWSEKYSKYIGVYFPLINSTITLSAFTIIMSNEFLKNFDKFSVIDSNNEIWTAFAYGLLIGFLLINLVYFMNALTTRPGKIFQQAGTIIKLIPLFTIIIIGLLIVFGTVTNGSPTDPNVPNKVFDFNHPTQDMNLFVIVLLLTPTIMFSYDGFLSSASLQSEAKKKSTYKTALITGMVFTIFIYLIVSYFSFKYGDPSESNGFSVTTTISSIFPNSEWLPIFISAAIMVSIITALSGTSISQNRMLADLSASNVIRDPNGNLLARNRALVPQNAAIISWISTLIFFFVFRGLDALALWSFVADINHHPGLASYRDYSIFPIHGWTIDFVTLISFCFYIFVIVGAINNRRSGKVDVEKNIFFVPAAFLSVILISVILYVFAYGLFVPGDFNLYDSANNVIGTSIYRITTYSMDIIVALAIIGLIFLLGWWFKKDADKFTKEEKIRKSVLIENYRAQKIDPRYLKNL